MTQSNPRRKTQAIWEIRPIPSRAMAGLAYAMLALFAALTLLLARANHSGGNFDSEDNLVVGRNIARGLGFTNGLVQQYSVPERLPGPELVRPPGIPYLIAAGFRVLGEGGHVQIMINGLALILTALLLRAALRRLGAGWAADVAAILVLLAHNNYVMIDIWNNGVLAALTTALLYAAVLHETGRLRGFRFVTVCAIIGAAGFLTKQSFIVTVVPVTCLLTLTEAGAPLKRRVIQLAVFAAILLALTSPLWIRNLMLFGNPLYYPLSTSRLAVRYGLHGTWFTNPTVLYGDKITYATLLKRVGILSVLNIELIYVRDAMSAIGRLGGFVVIAAVLGTAAVARRDWKIALATVLLMAGSLFDTYYNHVEDRYLWPVFPCLIALAWLGVRGSVPSGEGQSTRPKQRARWIAASLISGALLLAAGESVRGWRDDFLTARQAPPSWQSAVASLPPDAVIMTWPSAGVAWYTDRPAISVPLGRPDRVFTVLRSLRPTHFLIIENEYFSSEVTKTTALLNGYLTPVVTGTGWSLYHLDPRAFSDDRGI